MAMGIWDGTKNADLMDLRGKYATEIWSYEGNDQVWGSYYSEKIYADSGNDTVDGGAGADSIHGWSGDDLLYGGTDDDWVIGGTGLDSIDGGTGNDRLEGEDGDDRIDGGDGYDLLYGGIGNDLLYGGNHNDELHGNAGNDTLYGGSGDDLLEGYSGNDYMAGSIGNDWYGVDSSLDTVFEAAGAGTDTLWTSKSGHTLQANVENLVFSGIGPATNRTGIGNQDNNLIAGHKGNDLLVGNGGDDVLIGGEGGDNLSGSAGNDTLSGGGVIKSDIYGRIMVDETRTPEVNLFNDDGVSDALVGGAGNDTYHVFAGDTVLEQANEGADAVETALKFYMLGNHIENLVFRSPGTTFDPNTHNEVPAVQTGIGNELGNSIHGNLSYSTQKLYGMGGDDVLKGGSLSDTLDGGSGNDTMMGGYGADSFYVDSALDVASDEAGSTAIDQVFASAYSHVLGTGVENLYYTGSGTFTGAGNGLDNLIVAGAGNATLHGHDGNDTLDGAGGADYLSGGLGNDVFRYDAIGDSGVGAGNRDTVSDFRSGADHFDFSAIVTPVDASGQEGFDFIGDAAFSAIVDQAEVRAAYDASLDTTFVQLDLEGDGVVNMEIALTGNIPLTASDFML